MVNADVAGKTVIITGANSGIGFETAKTMAKAGAHVIVAVRNQQKGEARVTAIQGQYPNSKMEVMELNLADLEKVKLFARSFMQRFSQLDLLINNAGVMTPPYQLTKNGFELQFGSNHLGHFALTGLLLPLLIKTHNSRVVTVSSIAHRRGDIFFDNLDGSKGYKPMAFYQQSKLANLMFAISLDELLKKHHLGTKSIGCHPGISHTNLFSFTKEDSPALYKWLANKVLQPAQMGALPTLFAATEPSLKGGEYIGPDGFMGMKGHPTIETPAKSAFDEEKRERLWSVSEKLTGVSFDF